MEVHQAAGGEAVREAQQVGDLDAELGHDSVDVEDEDYVEGCVEDGVERPELEEEGAQCRFEPFVECGKVPEVGGWVACHHAEVKRLHFVENQLHCAACAGVDVEELEGETAGFFEIEIDCYLLAC